MSKILIEETSKVFVSVGAWCRGITEDRAHKQVQPSTTKYLEALKVYFCEPLYTTIQRDRSTPREEQTSLLHSQPSWSGSVGNLKTLFTELFYIEILL